VNRREPVGPDARAQLLALLNDVRRDAGLPAVALSARESAVAAEVAPHYFAALAGHEPELVADEVVLGLRAGWEIDGDVRSGAFTYGIVEKTDDLGRLLDTVLERPSGREVLLDRAARTVAIGPVVAPAQQLIGLVASSYQIFEQPNHAADAQRVLGRLTKARVTMHMPPPVTVLDLVPEAQEATARVERGESSPRQALRRMLDRTANRNPGYLFRGFVLEMSSVEDIVFPSELLRTQLSGVAIAVGHYRPKGAPWSRLIVFVLAASAAGSAPVSAARDAHAL
jgi:hypothetical protein